jgi:hypothetical protein
MAGDEPVHGLVVAILAPTLGEQVLVLRLQQGEPPDFFEIAGEADSITARSSRPWRRASSWALSFKDFAWKVASL